MRNKTGQLWIAPPGLSDPQFQALLNLDMDAVKQPDVDLIAILATQYLKGTVLNQPIRAGGDSFAVEIGHRWYADAKRQTQALDF